MEQDNINLCDQCDAYMLGECSKDERETFKEHLLTCPVCRGKIRDFHRIWQALPSQLEEVEVPADMKSKVMWAIFSGENENLSKEKERIPQMRVSENIMHSTIRKPAKRFVWNWSSTLIAVMIPLLMVSIIWNFALLKNKDVAQKADELQSPAQIISFMSLKAASPAYDSVRGTACLLEKGKRTMLVVYLHGLNATTGNEAYQVWLKRNGQRSNAGTFQVGSDGFGVLTIDMQSKESIDSIGVTLEPDSHGTQPRGTKVVGT